MSLLDSAPIFQQPSIQENCPNVENFLYDPSNCDPGYWCGCFDPNPENCYPSNDLNETSWAGHYTVTDGTETIVYTGWAQQYSQSYFECPDTLYCPGNNSTDPSYCPQLCEPGSYCPDAATSMVCPDGHYCLMGSTEPTECEGLQMCRGEGNEIYRPVYGLGVVVLVVLVLFGLLILAYRRLNHLAPFRKSAKVDDSSKSLTEIADTEEQARESTLVTPAPSQQINVAFQNLQLTLPNGKCIMQGVSGALPAGTFTAIMGPSGAGKSTFLSLLSGKVDRTGGHLQVNGAETPLTLFRRLVGFVPQEDVMLRELTVYDNVRHAAMMRLPASWTREQKLQRVEQVLQSLELTEIRDSVIGDELRRGISGGQRKRVNVAMELVADPSLLCLDEPTSGLDSTTSYNLTATLRALAQTGVNVAAVLHQPKNEIFELFDHVLLLGVGGRTVYLGPASEMTAYFTKIGFPLPPRTNPADYYMDVVAGEIPNQHDPKFVKENLFELWRTADENPHKEEETDDETLEIKEVQRNCVSARLNKWAMLLAHVFFEFRPGPKKARTTPGYFGQTTLLFRRAVLQRLRNPQNTFWPLILAVFAGGLAGLSAKAMGLAVGPDNSKPIYYGIPIARTDTSNASFWYLNNWPSASTDNVVALWQNTVLAVMLVSVLGINVFGRERAVFFRDAASGTKVASYWAAKTLETFIWLPVFAAAFTAVAYAVQPLVISLVDMWVVVWMAYIGFYGLGSTLSLVVGAENRGILMLVASLVLILAFTGLLFPFSGKGIFKIFYTFWTSQAYGSRTYEAYDPPFDTELFNESYADYDLSYTWAQNVGYAFLTGFAWHMLTLILLKTCDFRKQR